MFNSFLSMQSFLPLAHIDPGDKPEYSDNHGVYTSRFGQVFSKLWVVEVESSILGGYTVMGGFPVNYVTGRIGFLFAPR